MAQWDETITHLECDWCAAPVTFAEGKRMENEGYSKEECICGECRRLVEEVHQIRVGLQDANRLKNRPIPYTEKARTTQYAPPETQGQDDLLRKAQDLKGELQSIQDALQRKMRGQE